MPRREGITTSEPPRGGHPDLRLFGLSGIEQLRASLEGRSPRPPISYLFGIKFESVSDGTAVFSMGASEWLLAPQGVVAGSTLAVLVDAPLGCAAQSKLPPATAYTTAELSLVFVRPVTATSGRLVATGTSLHAGRSMAVTSCTVVDAHGRVVALAQSRLYVFDSTDSPTDAAEVAPVVEPEYPTPHPYERPVEGGWLDAATLRATSGLAVVQGCMSGEFPVPPLGLLTGVQPVAAEEGHTEWRLPASEWLTAPPRERLQGGAVAMLAGHAAESAMQTVVPARHAFVTVDLKVYFMRPARADGRDLLAEGTVLHAGRSLMIATSTVSDADGKLVAMATASAQAGSRSRP